MDQWELYHQQVGDKPNTLVVSVLKEYVTARGRALDLGAGNLRDSKFLRSEEFNHVVAVDCSYKSLPFLTEGIELEICPIQLYEPEVDAFDFVIACNILFFLTLSDVADVFRKVLRGLHPGGVFTCNVLGPEDDWIVKQGHPAASFTKTTLKSFCSDFKIIAMREFREYVTPPGATHTKFWHQWSVVLKKP